MFYWDEPEAPLLPGQTLTLGYNTDEESPVKFFLPAGHELDVSFMKLLLLKQRAEYDMRSLVQIPPVDSEDGGVIRARCPSEMPALDDVWDTVVIPVVVRPGGGDSK